ncbi:hypothetical protein PL10110_550027 [Planktothrix agardhii]|nr:hypothetical protein PL10110_550027 [Planktothrix agardhii]
MSEKIDQYLYGKLFLILNEVFLDTSFAIVIAPSTIIL